MIEILNLARNVASSNATVLILGESGTGKELLASYVHQHSGRNKGPYVAVNCAALPESLSESELFGHEKGSFTGAASRKIGKFELANQGTILLDEISEMAMPLQAKLLRVLQEREIDYIALAGYLQLLPGSVVKAYHNRIVNIHPAPLPKYGGKGMYGHHVHEAVVAAGDTVSGPTVHLVDEIYDHGKILEHSPVEVLPDDTPETLAARVLIQEHKLYPRVLQKLIKGEYSLD